MRACVCVCVRTCVCEATCTYLNMFRGEKSIHQLLTVTTNTELRRYLQVLSGGGGGDEEGKGPDLLQLHLSKHLGKAKSLVSSLSCIFSHMLELPAHISELFPEEEEEEEEGISHYIRMQHMEIKSLNLIRVITVMIMQTRATAVNLLLEAVLNPLQQLACHVAAEEREGGREGGREEGRERGKERVGRDD